MGRIGYVTLAILGFPYASKRGTHLEVVHKGADGLCQPCHLGMPNAIQRATQSVVAHKWVEWLQHPCRQGGVSKTSEWGCTQPLSVGNSVGTGPQVGGLAMSTPPSRGSPTLQNGHSLQWATKCQISYVILAVCGFPNASERGRQLEMAPKWADWVRRPYRVGGPQNSRLGDTVISGPQMGKLATEPLPSGVSPMLQSGGHI